MASTMESPLVFCPPPQSLIRRIHTSKQLTPDCLPYSRYQWLSDSSIHKVEAKVNRHEAKLSKPEAIIHLRPPLPDQKHLTTDTLMTMATRIPMPIRLVAQESPKFSPVRACLFDMDGLLLNTEDMYTSCNNAILHKYNRPSLPWAIKAQMQGRPGPEASEIFKGWAKLPIDHADYLTQLAELHRLIFPSAQPLPGVATLLSKLSASGTHLALATSSHSKNYALKTGHLRELFDTFPKRQVVLGDDSRIPKGRGKPAPEIYLLALETINRQLREEGKVEILPEECLVFEDSVPGVEAGRRAGMRTLWCPHPMILNEYRGREALVMAGLTSMSETEKTPVSHVINETGTKRLHGWPGRIGDGWTEQVQSLEHFCYERYGILA